VERHVHETSYPDILETPQGSSTLFVDQPDQVRHRGSGSDTLEASKWPCCVEGWRNGSQELCGPVSEWVIPAFHCLSLAVSLWFSQNKSLPVYQPLSILQSYGWTKGGRRVGEGGWGYCNLLSVRLPFLWTFLSDSCRNHIFPLLKR